jgi:hypothetical protein
MSGLRTHKALIIAHVVINPTTIRLRPPLEINTSCLKQYAQIRSCTNPTPRYGGSSCSGSSIQYKYIKCNTHYCRSKYDRYLITIQIFETTPRNKHFMFKTICTDTWLIISYPLYSTTPSICSSSWSLNVHLFLTKICFKYLNSDGFCSASCTKCGSSSFPQRKYYKTRSCTNPTPRYGGSSCSGSSIQYKYIKCNTHYCRSKYINV